MSFSSFSQSKSGIELYYWRIDQFLETVGRFNQVRGVYDKLDCWMPPEVANVYNRYYGGNPRVVVDKYNEFNARMERQWRAIIESCRELGITLSEQDAHEFRTLARSTQPETSFRTSVRHKVKRLYDNAVKHRSDPCKIKPTMSLRELIQWYQRR